MLLGVHIVAAGLGLVLGLIALVAAKGGKLHRKSGLLFVGAIATMCVSAVILAVAHGQVLNVIAGVMTAYLVITALTTVRPPAAGARQLELGLMLLALGFGATTLFFGLQGLASADGKAFGDTPIPYIMFGAIGMLAGAGDLRMIRKGGLRGTPRLTRHLWRMCWAFWIATASFFLGPRGRVAAVLPESLVPPALYPLPVLAVLLAMFYWLWRVRRRSFLTLPAAARRTAGPA